MEKVSLQQVKAPRCRDVGEQEGVGMFPEDSNFKNAMLSVDQMPAAGWKKAWGKHMFEPQPLSLAWRRSEKNKILSPQCLFQF